MALAEVDGLPILGLGKLPPWGSEECAASCKRAGCQTCARAWPSGQAHRGTRALTAALPALPVTEPTDVWEHAYYLVRLRDEWQQGNAGGETCWGMRWLGEAAGHPARRLACRCLYPQAHPPTETLSPLPRRPQSIPRAQKYQNRRPEYVTGIWDVLNWSGISDLYETALKGKAAYTALDVAKPAAVYGEADDSDSGMGSGMGSGSGSNGGNY